MAPDDQNPPAREPPPVDSTDILSPVRTLSGKYKLGRLLGEGGMGAVYEAEHLGLEAKVAIKLLSQSGSLDHKALTRFRRRVQFIFQDPFASLNPRQTVGTAIAAPMVAQKISPPGGLKSRVKELLDQVGLKPEHYNRFPHEFSGGQRQRVGIARAISLNPSVIVCDEPVSALDVSVQAQVVNLLQQIQRDTGVSYIFIAHDLSVVRHISHEVAVMYLGKIVEQGPRDALFSDPRHPYTKALLSAVPLPDPKAAREQVKIRLRGDLPSPANPPSGCVFRTRCPLMETLSEEQRQLCMNDVPAPATPAAPACHHSGVARAVLAGMQ